ncbi:MAG: Ni/Fe-hydrogenase, b-type cytochrome subunit [Proteobacteria bacterium]|nr:Ni/Fe-hydrogenase, b-type cytochrome subunit [Pseudomonadota bacterium]
MSKNVYVWEFPVRLTHWLNFLSILVLSFTGIYIGTPFMHSPPGESSLMAIIRFFHFVAAYVFTVSCLLRLYWAFAGNEYSRWREFFPVTGRRRREIWENVKFYMLLKKNPPPSMGHSSTAVLSYLGLFFLFVVEIITGFGLYAQSHQGFFWTLMGGWLLFVFSSPTVRLIHHLVMWLILVFAIIHVYIGWLNDIAEKNGVMSSIFSGYKTAHED